MIFFFSGDIEVKKQEFCHATIRSTKSIMIEVKDNPNEYIDEEKNEASKRMQNNACDGNSDGGDALLESV